MNGSKLEIIDKRVFEGVAKSTGRPFKMTMAQCIVTKPDGAKVVGELALSDALVNTPNGEYLAVFDLESYQGKVQARVANLSPWKALAQKGFAHVGLLLALAAVSLAACNGLPLSQQHCDTINGMARPLGCK